MASQIGTQRIYRAGDGESTSAQKVSCPLCKVQVVPRGIVSTRRLTDASPRSAQVGNKAHCPNCGHVFGLKDTNPAE